MVDMCGICNKSDVRIVAANYHTNLFSCEDCYEYHKEYSNLYKFTTYGEWKV